MKASSGAPGNMPFEEPVTIKCVVNGKNLLAKIIAETNDPVQQGFVIKFSDGIVLRATGCEDSDMFETDNNLHAAYLDAIQQELRGFLMVMHGDWYKFEISHNNQELLIWISANYEKEYSYTVYFNGDYQFDLREKDGVWESRSVRIVNPNSVDAGIVDLIVKELKEKINQYNYE